MESLYEFVSFFMISKCCSLAFSCIKIARPRLAGAAIFRSLMPPYPNPHEVFIWSFGHSNSKFMFNFDYHEIYFGSCSSESYVSKLLSSFSFHMCYKQGKKKEKIVTLFHLSVKDNKEIISEAQTLK